MNRYSSAVLIVLSTSGNHRSFAAGNGDANANVASTATPEETANAVAYKARLAARAAADEGFSGRGGNFRAARKKFNQAIELDPKFSPAYRLRADACLKMSDWAGAIVDLDTDHVDPNDAEIFNERGLRALQIAELSTRETAFIENLRVVWIERDQGVEINDRARPIGHLQTCVGTKPIRGRKFRIELDRLIELLPRRTKISSPTRKKALIGGRARCQSGFEGNGLFCRFFRRCCRCDVRICVAVSGRERPVDFRSWITRSRLERRNVDRFMRISRAATAPFK